MAPLSHPALDIFLLGVIVAASTIAALFFLRFYRETRDPLFLAFFIFFVVFAVTHAAVLSLQHPNEGSAVLFLARFLGVFVVLGAILRKNVDH